MRAGSLSHVVTVLAAFALAAPAAAQHAHGEHAAALPTQGLRAEMVADVTALESKYLGLLDAMAGKLDWRPAEGVRSAGEVFMHIAGANFMMPMMAGVQPPEMLSAADMPEAMQRMQALEKESDPSNMREMLAHSFMHAKHAIASIPDAEMDAMTSMFGRDATKREVLSALVTHMHEHLGQSIAYARVNGIVPPWSGGGGAP